MRDHTSDFKLQELSSRNKELVRAIADQLLNRIAADDQLSSDTLLEFWVEVPGVKRPRGTYSAGFLMPDSFIYITDYVRAENGKLVPADGYSDIEQAREEMFDELYYQIEIFTSQVDCSKGITLELWTGHRNRPEGEWVYALDRKIELV
ncbi:MAG TPA: hypothetical protein ENN50_10005 [Prosthecochloris aestuarii]|uniref:Uncharacterized protein n=1 Tax=Prosthecochloris aestuarii TaxID=1102 RepID=A0A831STT5_PROAE|nr:hypothetical protein [Prosthecochloris aestuarii]